MKPEEAISSLLERRLLDVRDLVVGDVRVEDRSARHRNLAVHSTSRPGLFIKQASPGDVIGTLDAEAAFYQLVQLNGRLSSMRPFVPRLLHYDARSGQLVLELLPDAETARHSGGGETQPAAIGASLGRALAACHQAGTADDPETRATFPAMRPWAFQVALPAPEIFRDATPLQLELMRLVQGQGDIVDQFRGMYRVWEWSAFIHGDLRWANVLVAAPGEVRLIDWEAAGLGDPAWDVACAFEGWLARGLETLELAEGDGPDQASRRFDEALPAIQQQTRTFWQSYVGATDMGATACHALLGRAMAYTPARLLQSAHEWSRGRVRFTPFILFLVQLAISMWRRPAASRAGILGIGVE